MIAATIFLLLKAQLKKLNRILEKFGSALRTNLIGEQPRLRQILNTYLVGATVNAIF